MSSEQKKPYVLMPEQKRYLIELLDTCLSMLLNGDNYKQKAFMAFCGDRTECRGCLFNTGTNSSLCKCCIAVEIDRVITGRLCRKFFKIVEEGDAMKAMIYLTQIKDALSVNDGEG